MDESAKLHSLYIRRRHSVRDTAPRPVSCISYVRSVACVLKSVACSYGLWLSQLTNNPSAYNLAAQVTKPGVDKLRSMSCRWLSLLSSSDLMSLLDNCMLPLSPQVCHCDILLSLRCSRIFPPGNDETRYSVADHYSQPTTLCE